MSTTRKEYVTTAKKYLGYNEKDGTHKKIIDIYNGHSPLARSYKVQYTDSWCATFVSAIAILTKSYDIIPTECSCDKMIALFKKIGCWKEDDSYTPSMGDIIFYDWQDSGKGDNTGSSDHVGIVTDVTNGTITVIEGNKNDAVAYRTIKVNGRYIRGYGLPNFDKESKTISDSQNYDKNLVGKYKVTSTGLNVRKGAGTNNQLVTALSKGDFVNCYGFYNSSNGTKWLLVEFTQLGKKYTGYASSKCLKKVD